MNKLFLLPLCFFSANLFAQNSSIANISKVENGLTSIVRYTDESTWNIVDRMENYQVPGVSIAVIKDYKIDWAKAYGISNQSTGEKVTTETTFQAASISKTINAIGVLKWANEHQVDLDADINSLLKSWQFPYDDENKISLTHLLSHTAGLSVHGFPGYVNHKNLPTTLQIVNGEKPANNKPVRSLFPSEEKFKYSGGGTTISQMILEDHMGNYSEYMKKNIFDPLGMTRSFYPTNFKGNVSMSHNSKGQMRKNGYNIYPELAAAALWTTPTDLAKLIIELQLSLDEKSQKILSQNQLQTMFTPPMKGTTNALGTFIDSEGEISYFQHSGGNEGFNCLYYASMEKGHGAVVMINAEKFELIHEIMRSIAQAYDWSTYLPTTIERVEPPTEKSMKKFVGIYRSIDFKERTVKVFMKKDQLFIEQKKRWKSVLIPQKNNTFITADILPSATITFENGKMTVEQGDKYEWIKE